VTEKNQHVLASLDGTPGAIFPIFVWVRTFTPSLIFQVSSRSVQVWGKH